MRKPTGEIIREREVHKSKPEVVVAAKVRGS
jgi:hypothetical protein